MRLIFELLADSNGIAGCVKCREFIYELIEDLHKHIYHVVENLLLAVMELRLKGLLSLP
jgi:hypothetical protein